MTAPALHPTRCAICGTLGNADEMHAANFTEAALTPAVFSARRLPDRIHYRIVKCRSCGLVRSDPVVAPEVMAELYSKSSFDYEEETLGLKKTYGRYLRRLSRHGARKDLLLEVGCGNGLFLEEALAQGWADARGVEPSSQAIAQAAPALQGKIVCDIMRPGLFPPETFDAFCLFQALDHIPDPAALLRECLRILRPGGLALCLNHNIESVSARLMGEASPIVDIEHTCLFSQDTMRRLFSACGFDVVEQGAAFNSYSLGDVARLVPAPGALKRAGLALLQATRIGRIPVRCPLGNIFIIARRPKTA